MGLLRRRGPAETGSECASSGRALEGYEYERFEAGELTFCCNLRPS